MKQIRLRQPRRRPLSVETLDPRLVLAGSWHNDVNPRDVNFDGTTRALDVLAIINTIDRFGGGPVQGIKERWAASDPSAPQLSDGFFPDTNGDDHVSMIDALLVINWFGSDEARELKPRIEISKAAGGVAVIDDADGSVRVVYTAADGRSKSVSIAVGANVERNGDDITVNALDGQSQVIVKIGVGVLEADYSGADGLATVTRLADDGSTIIETYVCVPVIGDPGWPIFTIQLPIEIPTPDVRQPIDGFEEAVGAIVRREITRADQTLVVQEYREASRGDLVSISVTLPDDGPTASVEFARVIPASQESEIDLDVMEQKLIELLRSGVPLLMPLTPRQLDEALQAIADLEAIVLDE